MRIADHRHRSVVAVVLTVALLALTPATAFGGTVRTWGDNTYGQLGDGTFTSRLTAVRVHGLSGVVELHGGREHVVALKGDGTVWTWGRNRYGQLGIGNTANRNAPVRVQGITHAIQVTTGHYTSFALLANGTVKAWGCTARSATAPRPTAPRR